MSDPLQDLARLDGVPSAMAAALAAVDGVLRDRGLRQVEAPQVADAAWASARAAAQLAQTESEDERGETGDAAHTPEAMVAALVRMYAEVPQLADLVTRSPAQALARLHTVWGRGLLPDSELGVVRSDDGVATRLAALLEVLAARTDAPALVVAGVVHAELWSLRPFPRGSWAVALGCEQAVLIGAGVDPRGVIPLALGHQNLGDHATALAAFRSGTATGMRGWLLHEGAAVSRAVELSALRPVRRKSGPA